MQFRFFQILIAALLFFCTMQPAMSQNETNREEIINLLDEKYGIDQQLYRGVKYFPKVNLIAGHAYLFDPDFISSKIKYREKMYHPVLLKYDIELDELIIKTPEKYGAELQLILDPRNVDAFWLGDRYFINNTNIEIPARFVQIISADSLSCIAAYSKEFKFMRGGRNEGYGFTDKNAKYYIKTNSTLKQVKTRRALLKLLPKPHIADVKQYLAKQNYKFSKMTDVQWIQLCNYINDLYE